MMNRPTCYIQKKDLVSGSYYLGICRNSSVGLWDSKANHFVYIRYKFGWRLDDIEHFDDVKESGKDGFIPIQLLEDPDSQSWTYEFIHEIGY